MGDTDWSALCGSEGALEDSCWTPPFVYRFLVAPSAVGGALISSIMFIRGLNLDREGQSQEARKAVWRFWFPKFLLHLQTQLPLGRQGGNTGASLPQQTASWEATGAEVEVGRMEEQQACLSFPQGTLLFLRTLGWVPGHSPAGVLGEELPPSRLQLPPRTL